MSGSSVSDSFLPTAVGVTVVDLYSSADAVGVVARCPTDSEQR